MMIIRRWFDRINCAAIFEIFSELSFKKRNLIIKFVNYINDDFGDTKFMYF